MMDFPLIYLLIIQWLVVVTLRLVHGYGNLRVSCGWSVPIMTKPTAR